MNVGWRCGISHTGTRIHANAAVLSQCANGTVHPDANFVVFPLCSKVQCIPASQGSGVNLCYCTTFPPDYTARPRPGVSHGGATPPSKQADFIPQSQPSLHNPIQPQRKHGTEQKQSKHNEKAFDRHLAVVVLG